MSSAMMHFSPFSQSTWYLLGALAHGLEGKGAVSICASKRGLTLKIGRYIAVRGKNADELWINYEILVGKARREAGRSSAKIEKDTHEKQ